LALQAELIDARRFAEACTAWSARKETSLADLLVERGWLTPEDCADVNKILNRKLARHGGDARAGLAEVTTDRVRRSLAGLTDTDIRASIDAVTPPPVGHVLVTTTDHVPDSRERYTLSRLHATGGIGRVWLARDQSLGRDVALKELLPERAARPELWTRFLREARITGQMEHPGVVPIYELGQRPDDRAPFYTMRFVRGRTLAEAAAAYHRRRRQGDAGPLELRGLLTAFVGVCNAVGYAHSRGVIHRDLKPQNVVLGDYGEAIVLDWGLARVLAAPDADDADLPPLDAGPDVAATMQGQALGTPAYMAPEQAEGRVDLFGPRTDVYGLGAILYEILTSRPPFIGNDTTAVLRDVIHGELPRPRSVVERTSASLEAVCLKALARRPAERYESAKALAADVERWMADEPVSAWREPFRVRAGRWVRKRRTAVAMALAVLIVAVVGLIGITAVQAESRRQLAGKNWELADANSRLAEARDRAERRVDLALGAVENFRSAVDGNLDVQNRPENAALRKTLLQAPLAFYRRLRDDLQESNDAGPEARSKLADAYFQLADLNYAVGSQPDSLAAWDEAVTLLEVVAQECPEALRPTARERLATALHKRGTLQSETKGMADAALESYGRAREELVALIRERPADSRPRVSLARVLNSIAFFKQRTGKADEALDALRTSHDVLAEADRQSPHPRDVDVLLVKTDQQVGAVLLNNKGRLPEALAALQKAAAAAEVLAEKNSDDTECQELLSATYSYLGRAYDETGATDKALEIYGKRLALAEGMVRSRLSVGAFRLRHVKAIFDLAWIQGHVGRHDEALGSIRKALDAAKALSRDNPNNKEYKREIASIWNLLAVQEHARGRLAEAVAALQASGSIQEDLARSDPSDVDNLRDLAGNNFNIAIISKSLGRSDSALAAFRRALELRERLAREHADQPKYTLDVGMTLSDLGLFSRDQHNFAEGRDALRRSVETLEKLTAAYPDNAGYRSALGRSLENLGLVLSDMGQADEGAAALRRSLAQFERSAREQPQVVQNQHDLAGGHATLATVLRKANRADEADAEDERAVVIREALLKTDPAFAPNRDELADLLQQMGRRRQARGRPAEAAKAYRRAAELLEKLTDPDQVYALACCHALLATPGVGSADEGDKAMESLQRAVAAGFHDVEKLHTDKDLDAVRGRPAFKQLVADEEKRSAKKKD
jgi:serine/threonine-protein kinase